MPSGEVSSVLISDIIINRGDRIRRELDPKRVADLADSINRIGLIHFPVITRDFVLVSGETRLRACGDLGWSHIPVQWADELSESESLEIELEENVKRTDLTWQDQCDALRRYHELKKEQRPDWRLQDTADSIGLATSTVQSFLAVAKEIAAGNERVISAPKMSTARGIVQRKIEREAADIKALVLDIEEAPPPAVPFLQADFNEWAPRYSGPSFNLINCDFPYGINADKMHQGAAASFGGYEDSFEVYERLCVTLKAHKVSLMGESCHLIFWFSMKHYTWTLEFLRSMELWIDPYPLIWHKSDNKGTLPDPERGPRRVYEVAFLASTGDRKIVTPKSNVFSAPTVRTGDHMSEKNEVMLAHFFSMLCDTNTRLLDPTCGSGSALRAARSLGVESVLGLERDPEFLRAAVSAWNG